MYQSHTKKNNYKEYYYNIVKKENYQLVKEALEKAGRKDLIGFGKECLIKPEKKDLVKGKVQNPKGKQRKTVAKRKKK